MSFLPPLLPEALTSVILDVEPPSASDLAHVKELLTWLPDLLNLNDVKAPFTLQARSCLLPYSLVPPSGPYPVLFLVVVYCTTRPPDSLFSFNLYALC